MIEVQFSIPLDYWSKNNLCFKLSSEAKHAFAQSVRNAPIVQYISTASNACGFEERVIGFISDTKNYDGESLDCVGKLWVDIEPETQILERDEDGTISNFILSGISIVPHIVKTIEAGAPLHSRCSGGIIRVQFN